MKTMSLTVLAALAAAAMMAIPGVASAATDLHLAGGEPGTPEVVAEGYPATPEAKRYESESLKVLGASFGDVRCEAVQLEDSTLNSPQSYLELKAPNPETTEDFSECAVYWSDEERESNEAAISMNHCDLAYSGFEHEAGPDYTGAASVSCSSDEEVEIKIGVCEIGIPAQNLDQDIAMMNTYSSGELLRVHTTGSGLTYKILTPIACSMGGIEEGTHEDGTMDMDLLVRNVYLSGGVGKVEATEYPKTITGERLTIEDLVGEVTVLEVGGLKVSCQVVGMAGGTLTAPAYELTLGTTFSECALFNEQGEEKPEYTVTMNSCSYKIPSLHYGAEGEYTFTGKIVCAEGGDAIDINGNPCSFSIPAQSMNSSSEAVNLEQFSSKEDIGVALYGSSLKYTAHEKYGCGFLGIPKGEHEDGAATMFLWLN